MIRHLAFGAVSLAAVAFAVPAYAADLPAYEPAPVVAVPSFSWTGAYVGVQAGYGWGRASRTKPEGFTIGGYAGYNYQIDASPLVVGIETDFNYADVDDSRRQNGGRTKASSDWNGATRLRIGYAADRVLFYGAGGLAYSDREFRRTPGSKDSKTAYGYTVGGGVEYAATDEIAVRADYRYSDYGKDSFNLNAVNRKSSYSEHRLMAGVSYKFNGF